MRYFVTIRDKTIPVDIEQGEVRVNGTRVSVDLDRVEGTEVRTLLLDGASYRVVATRDDGRWTVDVGGCHEVADVADERTVTIRKMTGDKGAQGGVKPVRAPMPGLVVKVEVSDAERVEPGQGLVVIEAMKMENELRAEVAARVDRIHVSDGEAVERGQLLIDLVPLDEA